LQEQRIMQNHKLIRYKACPLTDELAGHAILQLYRNEVIGRAGDPSRTIRVMPRIAGRR
jgi:hypothetical protein